MTNITNKEPLLFLCHRIPFPPNKGDKIRSFNILKKLSEKFDIYLGCFIDDPYDKQYVDELRQWCVESKVLDLNPTVAKLKSALGFITGAPLTIPYYYNKHLSYWVDNVVTEQNIQQAFVFSSSMAQYLDVKKFNNMNRIIDFVDVDSDKWCQYASGISGVMKYVYSREGAKLAEYEIKITNNFDAALFVSEKEAELFRSISPNYLSNKIYGINNGVNIDYFNINAEINDVPELNNNVTKVVFTGAMDYWANVDAVLWFITKVWPLILKKIPDAQFYIVGGNPTKEIQALAKQNSIIVTGRVDDVRPYIKAANAVVAPLQIARGIQNKVLEAMSMSKPVVATKLAMEGITEQETRELFITDDPRQFALNVIEQLSSNNALGVQNRNWIKEHFTWSTALNNLFTLFAKPEKVA